MAAAVLGGLTVSTLLSLLVVPAFYVVSDRLKASVSQRIVEHLIVVGARDERRMLPG